MAKLQGNEVSGLFVAALAGSWDGCWIFGWGLGHHGRQMTGDALVTLAGVGGAKVVVAVDLMRFHGGSCLFEFAVLEGMPGFVGIKQVFRALGRHGHGLKNGLSTLGGDGDQTLGAAPAFGAILDVDPAGLLHFPFEAGKVGQGGFALAQAQGPGQTDDGGSTGHLGVDHRLLAGLDFLEVQSRGNGVARGDARGAGRFSGRDPKGCITPQGCQGGVDGGNGILDGGDGLVFVAQMPGVILHMPRGDLPGVLDALDFEMIGKAGKALFVRGHGGEMAMAIALAQGVFPGKAEVLAEAKVAS